MLFIGIFIILSLSIIYPCFHIYMITDPFAGILVLIYPEIIAYIVFIFCTEA